MIRAFMLGWPLTCWLAVLEPRESWDAGRLCHHPTLLVRLLGGFCCVDAHLRSV